MMKNLSDQPTLRHGLSIGRLIATKLYITIGVATLLTIAAALVGWFSFNQVAEAQHRVNSGSVPELVAAFEVAQFSNTLVAAAPRLSASTSQDKLTQVADNIEAARAGYQEHLVALQQQEDIGESLEGITGRSDTLIYNINAIQVARTNAFEISRLSGVRQADFDELRTELDFILVKAIDDQLFYTVTGYRDREQAPAAASEHFSASALRQYRQLSDLQSDASIAGQTLNSAFTLSDPSLLEPLRERFEGASRRIEHNLIALDGTELHAETAPRFQQLFTLGNGDPNTGEPGIFELVAENLRLEATQRDLLAQNQDLAIGLLNEVDVLVATAQRKAQEATTESAQTIASGQLFLLSIGIFCVAGALMAILFVGNLIRRLEMLAGWMRRLAGGDLEARAEVGGRDEVADMASALEVFRLHALEIQRLNLVEQLAGELQIKNDQLEVVLADLQLAQDQIISREKLAELGQLTAGVAHEIRNPLNFINNFSESSQELLTELREVVDEDGVEMNDEQRDIVDEISQDLTGNLERIRFHGERANRIVQDMLAMGRGSGERRAVDINTLVEEHSALAYHSARASNTDFNLTIHTDFDPDLGEIEVVPQDFGRVILNIVHNSCYATNLKRQEIAAGPGGDYEPSLWLGTRREGDLCHVTIRDNGNGIPDDVVDKIFNPFFTTKPTDQGTGLGLAMCNDIVRSHGGNITVATAPGEYTEMRVTIPEAPLAAAAEAARDDGADYYDDDDD